MKPEFREKGFHQTRDDRKRQLSAQVSQDLDRRVTEACKREGISVSELMRRALEAYLGTGEGER